MTTGFRSDAPGTDLGLPDLPALGHQGLLTRLQVWLRRPWLDRALAAGADPHASRALAQRALQLTSDSKRRRLANAIGRLRADAAGPAPIGWSSAIPVNRDALIAADPILRAIEADLRDGVVYCQGVVALERLLTDGGSCLYVPDRARLLKSELAEVLDALEGRG
jgi:hypothetical protein